MSAIVQDPITGGQENRQYAAYLRGPIAPGVAAVRYALAVQTEVRNGVLHTGMLARVPAPQDSVSNDFGVQQSGGFTAEIVGDDLPMDGVSADQHWGGYSLTAVFGVSPIAFTRNLPIPVPDHEWIYRWTLADEFSPRAGCMRVHNLLTATDALATQTITVTAGTHILAVGKCTGTITLTGAATGTLTGVVGNRRQLITTTAAGSLTLTVTGDVREAMLLAVQGASYLVAPAYVPHSSTSVWPHNGFGVRGVVWRRTPNRNTVDASGNITDVVDSMQRQAWLYLPGRAGNIAECPSFVAANVTGDITLEGSYAHPQGAAPVGFAELLAKDDPGNYAYVLRLDASRTITLIWSANGSTLASAISTASVPAVHMAGVEIKATLDVDNGAAGRTARFAYRPYGCSEWIALGADVVQAGITSIFAGTGKLRIGASVIGGTSPAYRCTRAAVRSGIDGALVVEFDAARFAAGGSTATMATGDTWTITTSGSGNVARIVEAFTAATQRGYYHTAPETSVDPVDIGAWTLAGGVTTRTAVTGLDGLLSAWRLVAAAPYGQAVTQLGVAGTDTRTYSLMCLVAKDTTTSVVRVVDLHFEGGATERRHLVWLNTATGEHLATNLPSSPLGANGTHTVEDVGDWWLVRITMTNNGSGNVYITRRLYAAAGYTLGVPDGAAAGTATFGWPMLVIGERAEVYIAPPSTARATSVLTWPAGVINNSEGALYIEHQPDWIDATGALRYIVGRMLYSSGGALFAYDGANNAAAGTPLLAGNRTAISWSGNSMQAHAEASAQSSAVYDGAMIPQFTLGSDAGATPMQSGSINCIKIYNRRPSISQVAAINSARDPFSRGDFDWIRDNIKATTWELELLSQLTRANGATIEVSDIRRAVAKRVSITKNKLVVQFADVDFDQIDRAYPFAKFTKEEWANIFPAHIGRVVPDCSPGTIEKIPCSFINTNGTTTWTFAVCERRTGVTYIIVTLYRDGRIVAASEYTQSTATSASGLVVVTVVFAREQRDSSGRQYEFTADITASGSREPSREVERLLMRAGVAIDAASVTAAITEDAARGFFIDAAYAAETNLKTIIEYLLEVARCDLIKTATGAWALVQDKPRTSVATLREMDSLIDVERIDEPMPPKSYELKYRPRAPGATNDWQFTAARAGTGTAEVKRIINPYIYDGVVADRFIDYISKRENTRRDATLKVWGAMFDSGEVITVDGVSCYRGERQWLIRGVDRPTDANALTAREYNAAIYTYTAGTIPAAATAPYAPDYSQTPPAAPTSLTYTAGGSGTTPSADGTARAYMAYTVVAPAVNAVRIILQAQDATGGVARVEAKKNGGVYEAVLSNLRPGVSHTVSAYAINANGIEGSVVSEVRNSPGYSVAPGLVSMVPSAQIGTRTVQFNFTQRPASEMVDYYEYQISENGGGWSAAQRVMSIPFTYQFSTVGNNYAARVRAVDKFGNVGSYSGGYTIATARWAGATVIQDNAINRNRTDTAAGFASYNIASGAGLNIGLDRYAFSASYVSFNGGGDVKILCSTDITKIGGADVSRRRLQNDSAVAELVQVDYRIFNP